MTLLKRIVSAQDINTRLSLQYLTAEISVWPQTLDFGPVTGQPEEQTKNITLDDPRVVVFTISAPETYEVTVTADLPRHFVHEKMPGAILPVQLKLAYANNRETSETEARSGSRTVPPGITAFTFPVCRESGGIMLPPKINGTQRSETVAGKCHLFVFGTAGPSPGESPVIAGNYLANIHVMISASPPGG